MTVMGKLSVFFMLPKKIIGEAYWSLHYPSVRPSIPHALSICMSIHPPCIIRLYVHPSPMHYPSVHPSIPHALSVCTSIHPPCIIRLYVHPSPMHYPSVRPSIPHAFPDPMHFQTPCISRPHAFPCHYFVVCGWVKKVLPRYHWSVTCKMPVTTFKVIVTGWPWIKFVTVTRPKLCSLCWDLVIVLLQLICHNKTTCRL